MFKRIREYFHKKREERRIKRDLIDTSIALKEVYRDKNGNTWREYVNPLQMPATRAIAAEVATRFAEMNLTKEVLQALINEMKARANEGDIVSLFAILDEIDFRLSFLGEEETLIELATIYYVIDGEDETKLEEPFKEIKKNAILSDPEAKAFFLRKAWQLTEKFGAMSDKDIAAYLNRNAAQAKKILRFLRDSKSAGTSTTSNT